MHRALVALLVGGLAFSFVGNGAGISLPEGASVLGVVWTQDGTGLVALYRMEGEGVVELLGLPVGEALWRTGGLDLPPRPPAVAISPDGEKLAVGESQGVKILSMTDGKVLAVLELEAAFHPLALAFTGDFLAVALEEPRGFPGALHLGIWDDEGNPVGLRELGPKAAPASYPKAAFSPDGRFLAFAAGTEEEPDGEGWLVHVLDLALDTTRTFDLRALLPDLPWDDSKVQIAGLALSPEGEEIAVGLYSADPGHPLVLRLDGETGELLGTLFLGEGNSYVVEELAYSPNGKLLAFGAYSPLQAMAPSILAVAKLAEDGPVVTPLCRGRFPGDCPFRGPAFSPDGRKLVSTWGNAVHLWELCPDALELPTPGWSFSFSSGGAYHPKGYGEWRVRLDSEGRLEIAHRVRDAVEEFGPFRLEPEENAELWDLIGAADVPNLKSSSRAGLPDEPRYTFALEGPTCDYRLELWAGEVEERAALVSLRETLSRIIAEYTREEVVL